MCPTRCENNDCYIDRIKGTVTCTDGCEPGYCGTKCTRHCSDDCVTCDRHCGSCNVTLCPERRYGDDCSRVCNPRYEKCDIETGQCIRCRRGYFGDECTRECRGCFHTDDNLSDDCLSGCDKCQTEDACLTGFRGPSCELRCSPGCHDKGGCNKKTGECFTGCVSGYHGLACIYTCSEQCLSGRCNRATGECSAGCVSGYHGLTCNYTCSEHCLSGRCNRAAGECSAGCESGYHGLTCNYTCSEHCLSGRCNRATGECSAGCVSGYQGPTCQAVVKKDSENSMVLVIVLLAVILSVVLVLGITFLIWKKLFWRCRNRDQETHELNPLIPDELSNGQISVLKERTNKEIDSLSCMIHVSAVDTVVDMLQSRSNWVTITGNAGDGKTTLGYLVLKQLRETMSVYNIEEPAEYRQLLSLNEDRVIMFDDRFGAFTSDQVLIDKWKAVIEDIRKQFTLNGNKTKVIFISRKNVVNEVRVFLGHFRDTILDSENVVDLSLLKIKDERLEILDYYLNKGNLKIRTEVKQRLAHLDIAHGFPHCSMMYPKLKAKKRDLDIEEFFNTPLKFLDVTTSVLYNENCKDLFELMIKNNGRFNAYSVEDDKRRSYFLKVEREQDGSYITVWKNGVCEFAHPSIYESVLSVICETDPLFCVKYATLSVIRQKLILTSDEKLKSPTQINVKPFEPVLKALVKRFHPEVLQGNYSVFRHTFCENEDFCKELVASCVYVDLAAPQQGGSKQFINQAGEDGVTMLWTALKSGRMAAVQSLVKVGADVNIQDERGKTALHFLLQLQHSTAAGDDQQRMVMDNIQVIITEGRGDVNICDQYGQTPLHCLGHVQNSITVDDMNTIRILITKAGGDLNICDEYGHTPLHYLFKYRQFTAEEIKWIITDGKGDLNQCEQNKCTLLHYLCANSSLQLDTVDLVISEGKGDFNKADEYGSTPLFYLCDNENFEFDVVRRIVKNAKGDINKQDDNGITPLHVLCMKSHQIKDILTLIHQGDKADMFGNIPLHFLCRRRGINVEVLQQQLKQIPEDVMKSQNSLGYTPLDYLTDQDDQLPWRDGLIRRSPADLVLGSFNLQDRRIVVLGQKNLMPACIICGLPTTNDNSSVLTTKGCQGIAEASEQRGDNIHAQTGQRVHKDCRKKYTNPCQVKKSLATQCENDEQLQTPLLRSRETFIFSEQCLFCASSAKISNRKRGCDVFPVRTSGFQSEILAICDERGDQWSIQVRGRIECVNDLNAADAIYHQTCSVNFRTKNDLPKKYSNVDSDISKTKGKRSLSDHHFLQVIFYLEERKNEQVTLKDLVEKMTECGDGDAYSDKHMRRKLIDYYGDSVMFTSQHQRSDVVTIRSEISGILRQFHKNCVSMDEENEKSDIIQTAAKLIRYDIMQIDSKTDYYSSLDIMKSEDQNKQ